MAGPRELPDLIREFVAMAKDYLRQETLDPAKRLGRVAAFSIGAGVVLTIAKRALVQLGLGILIGMPLVAWILSALQGVGRIQAQSPILLTLVAGVSVMAVIGTLACSAPTLRALRIMPTEALREGG